MAEFVIARHGETPWNAERRLQGHADIPLNDRGRVQATALAERLASAPAFAAIYTSDLARAHETALIVGERLGLSVVTDAALREIDVGSWSGRTIDEIEAEWPGKLGRWRAGEDVHNGESRAHLASRVERAVLAIGSCHPGERLLLVAHGGVIRALQRIVEGTPADVLENCGTWAYRLRSGRLSPVVS
jgi:broad specificity phosphatase PhoE